MKFLVLILLSVTSVHASHIMGGFLSYKYLYGTTYEIKLTVYRNCNDGTPFDGAPGSLQQFASIGIFESATGTLVDTVELYNPIVTTLPFIPDSVCLVSNCIAKGVYSDTVNLPSSAVAYTIAYQRCCLIEAVINANHTYGETFPVSIPPTNLFQNDSPVLDSFPSAFYYINQPLVYQFHTYDTDSLRYSLCAPYLGPGLDDPVPSPPYAPPYNKILWSSPYSLDNLMGGVPLTIDSLTGIMTATPNTVGSFVVSVCIKEFRGQQLIDTNVVNLTFTINHCTAISLTNLPAQSSVRLFPNPATDELTITATESSETFNVYLFDIAGNLIRTINQTRTDNLTIKVDDLPQGLYLLKLENAQHASVTKRFAVVR